VRHRALPCDTWLCRATYGHWGSATWGQTRSPLPSDGQQKPPSRPIRTAYCQLKRAVCSAVGWIRCEPLPFDNVAIGFEPQFFSTAAHTLLVAWLRRATQGTRGSATWGQTRSPLPSDGQQKPPSRPIRTAYCQLKRAVCSAVGWIRCEPLPFDNVAIGFEPQFSSTAAHTLLVAWLRRATSRALVAPPPGAKHVRVFPAMAHKKDLRAPYAQLTAKSNARCVLRSDGLGANLFPSIM
jgi:hypothetical protein